MQRLFILIVGMPGSGKSLVVQAARDLGLPVYTMGDVVREETLRTYGQITHELMVSVSRSLREKHGDEVIALKIIERIPSDQRIVVIDGVRSMREVDVFRKHGRTVIIAIHASPQTRFRRLLERRRPGDPSSYNEFLRRDLTELGFGIGNVIAIADYMIVNECPPEETLNKAKSILMELVKEHGGNHS
ncbi:MAG: AAA family ATPase [Desulfurococcaceae archaeon]